jgi:hypothetical protein
VSVDRYKVKQECCTGIEKKFEWLIREVEWKPDHEGIAKSNKIVNFEVLYEIKRWQEVLLEQLFPNILKKEYLTSRA